MPPKTHLTTTEIAERYSAPPWLVRRVVDALGVDIPRAGLYRLVPVTLLPKIEAVLIKIGYPRRAEEEASHV